MENKLIQIDAESLYKEALDKVERLKASLHEAEVEVRIYAKLAAIKPSMPIQPSKIAAADAEKSRRTPVEKWLKALSVLNGCPRSLEEWAHVVSGLGLDKRTLQMQARRYEVNSDLLKVENGLYALTPRAQRYVDNFMRSHPNALELTPPAP